MTDIQAFIDKWQNIEWSVRLAANFAPRNEREPWLISTALLFELWDSAFGLSDERVARSKLAWWAEEAGLAIAGEARHPLVQALDVLGADLSSLPMMVRELTSHLDQATPRDQDAQINMLKPCALAASNLILSGPLHRHRSDASLANLQHCLLVTMLIYQLKCLAKPERFGPCALPTSALASAALRRADLHTNSADAAIALHRDLLIQQQQLRANGLAANGALLIAMARSVRRSQPGVFARLTDGFWAWRFARRIS
jgi:hypothetical protein